jgi:hypothetical protein
LAKVPDHTQRFELNALQTAEFRTFHQDYSDGNYQFWDTVKYAVSPTPQVFYCVYENDLERKFTKHIYSKEFLDCVYWIKDRHGLGKLRYNIQWNESAPACNMFRMWCEGETGYPIVDAAMTEMNTTGFMHHRGRLIVSNFLCRLLRIDWMKGKHYFASRLIDYDQAINDCNWHWVASMVTYAPRYKTSVYDPAEQSQIYDPKGHYIKRWLPRLRNIPVEHLHNWKKHHVNHDLYALDYYMPCLESYEEARDKCLVMYNRARYKTQNVGITRLDMAQNRLRNLQKVGSQLVDSSGKMYIKELMLSPEICFFSWLRPVSFQTTFLERLHSWHDPPVE